MTVSDELVLPSYTIGISFIAEGNTITIDFYGVFSIPLDEWEDSVRLGKSYYKIVNEYIKSSDEQKSLLENQNVYE